MNRPQSINKFLKYNALQIRDWARTHQQDKRVHQMVTWARNQYELLKSTFTIRAYGEHLFQSVYACFENYETEITGDWIEKQDFGIYGKRCCIPKVKCTCSDFIFGQQYCQHLILLAALIIHAASNNNISTKEINKTNTTTINI